MGTNRMMGRATSVAIGMALVCAACTDGDAAANDNGVVGSSTAGQSQTTEAVELLPYDEPITVPDGPDADDDAVDDADAIEGDGANGDSSTTVPNGEDNSNPDDDSDTDATLSSIVPPDEDDTTTTSTTTGSNTTNPPLNSDEEQPLQEETTALVCATVELGYLQQLGGNDGSERLREGAAMAIASEVSEYVETGQGLVDALDASSGIDSAADALLSQCETDGFERLA